MFGKIVVAFDNSLIGQQIFDEAVTLAKATGASVMLINVISPFDEYYPNPFLTQTGMSYPVVSVEVFNSYLEQWKELKQESINFLKSFCDRAQALGVKTELVQGFGDPGRAICDVARNYKADLIILGRRGHKGLGELFLGSVSNYVLHHAPCSVLIVQGATHATIESPENKQTAST
ncbi:MAG: universal stress protein [Scytonema sp. PMC 1069.18]|nr:universal stress protein [Scytonema sp. PMC 1069.18]MEC4881486.1 universal stress protein [Scytonema sp. PMC 1070.18]